MAGTSQRRVKDVMTRNVVTLSPEDTIHEALELLVSNRVSTLPVVDKRNHCVGILSTMDLVDFARDVDDDVRQVEEINPVSRPGLVESLIRTVGHEQVSSYMTDDVATVSAEAALPKAAQEMVRNRVHHLPVVDNRNHLVGIVSTMDILAEYADTEC